MSRCKGCGNEFRKGVTVFLLTAASNYKLKGARVCQSCASGGALLVAPKLAPVAVQKVVRSDGFARALRMLNTYAKLARSESICGDGSADPHQVGRAEGFEGAIETIKRECGGEP